LFFAFWLCSLRVRKPIPIRAARRLSGHTEATSPAPSASPGPASLPAAHFFNFPSQDKRALSFTIGPSAPRQEKNDTFTGPGTYTNIGIFIKPRYGDSLFGYGRVVVNDDGRSGTFNFRTAPGTRDDDDADYLNYGAAGAWDCGRKLTY